MQASENKQLPCRIPGGGSKCISYAVISCPTGPGVTRPPCLARPIATSTRACIVSPPKKATAGRSRSRSLCWKIAAPSRSPSPRSSTASPPPSSIPGAPASFSTDSRSPLKMSSAERTSSQSQRSLPSPTLAKAKSSRRKKARSVNLRRIAPPATIVTLARREASEYEGEDD